MCELSPPESWLPVVGYEGLYEVSDLGQVRSLDRTDCRGKSCTGVLLVPMSWGDYLWVRLSRNGRRQARHVHRLVLEAFIGPCPEGMEACHGPGGSLDNSLANLRWDTHAANMEDQRQHGTKALGEGHGNAKLTDVEVDEIRRRVAAGESQRAVAADLGVHNTLVSFIVRRVYWKHVA